MLSQDEKLLQRIKLEKEKRDMIEAEGRREKEPNLVNISKALDEYYIYEKLKIYAAYLSYKAFTSDSFLTYNETDFEFLPSILSKVSMLDNPIIETYDLLRQLFENKDDLKKGYYERDEVLVNRILYLSSNYIEEMTEKETIQIYSFLTNFCLYKFNNGFLEYTSLFLIFNNNIVNTFYRNNENSNMKLPPGIFRNMIVAAMRLKNSNQIFNKIETVGISPKDDTIRFKDAIEWAESFISIYKKKISSKNYQI